MVLKNEGKLARRLPLFEQAEEKMNVAGILLKKRHHRHIRRKGSF